MSENLVLEQARRAWAANSPRNPFVTARIALIQDENRRSEWYPDLAKGAQPMSAYLKHCPNMCAATDPVLGHPAQVSCLCQYQCAMGHCGCVARGQDCCLCGWSTWTDPEEVAQRREITFQTLAVMGFSL